MINDAVTIAADAYKDANRRKTVIYFLLIIAVVQVSVFSLYDEISLGYATKLIKDVGLAMVTLVGIISGLTIAFQVPRELRENAISTVLTKPLGQESYLIGKVLGVALLVVRNMSLVTLGILIIFMITGGVDMKSVFGSHFISSYLKSSVLAFIGVIDLVALALVFSIFLSEGIVVILSLTSLFVGNYLYTLTAKGEMIGMTADVLRYIFPNFYFFDIKSEVAAGLHVSAPYLIVTCAYGLVYAITATSLAIILFKKKGL